MYVSPRVEMVKMEASDMMACSDSVSAGGGVNIGYGGTLLIMISSRRIRIKTEDGISGELETAFPV